MGIYAVQGFFIFIFILGFLYRFQLTTTHLLGLARVQLTPFLGLSRSFQTPSTTAVSYVRVFPPRLCHNLICRSHLSHISSYICFVWAMSLWCCSPTGARSLTLQGVNPDRSRAWASNHCALSG